MCVDEPRFGPVFRPREASARASEALDTWSTGDVEQIMMLFSAESLAIVSAGCGLVGRTVTRRGSVHPHTRPPASLTTRSGHAETTTVSDSDETNYPRMLKTRMARCAPPDGIVMVVLNGDGRPSGSVDSAV